MPRPFLHFIRSFGGRALAVLLASCASLRAEEAFDAPGLVPAAFGIWTDRAGSSWSVEAAGNIGRIGSSMVNSGLALLVDDHKFVSYRPMMTADGKEFVLQGLPLEALPGLQVQRRVRLLDEPGGLRFAELFHNASADPMTISVGLATNFSGNFKTFLSDRGRSEPLLLGPSESGIVVLPGASQSSRAFLFTLAGRSGGTRPTVSSQNRYGLTFRYRLDLAPGETRVIVHHVAQVAIPQSFDRGTLQRLAAPAALDRLGPDSFDPVWRPFVANLRESEDESPRNALASVGLAALGIPPSATDTLIIGEGTRLPGKVEGEKLRLISAYGEREIPFEALAALTGGGHRDDARVRLYLRDGQVLSGQVQVENFLFVPGNGSRIPVDPAKIDRLLFAEASPSEDWTAGEDALVETHDGEILRVARSSAPVLLLTTPWGTLPVSLDELVWLRPLPGGAPGFVAEMQNGTRCAGYPIGEEVDLNLIGWGEQSLPITHVKRIYTPAAWGRRLRGDLPIHGAAIRVTGNQTLHGRVAEAKLALLSNGILIESPMVEIRRIGRLAETPAIVRFRVERWDGGVVEGSLARDFLAVQVANQSWQILPRDLQSVEFAPPELTPETTARIESLVADLASPEWAAREKATRELGAFGYLARPLLRRELAATTDPEVEQRLERILSLEP